LLTFLSLMGLELASKAARCYFQTEERH
jgi:hypothetical protein